MTRRMASLMQNEGASDPDAGRVIIKPRRALQGASDLDNDNPVRMKGAADVDKSASEEEDGASDAGPCLTC